MVVVRDDIETRFDAAFSDYTCIGGCRGRCGSRGGAFDGGSGTRTDEEGI